MAFTQKVRHCSWALWLFIMFNLERLEIFFKSVKSVKSPMSPNRRLSCDLSRGSESFDCNYYPFDWQPKRVLQRTQV
jgi:hypothetical protein